MIATSESDNRARRAARNQSLFRDVNERVKEISDGLNAQLPLGEWICECADDTCTERIELTMREYEQVRVDPAHFAVAPEHVFPEVERIIEQSDRYWVVEKTGDAAAVAEQFDPRTHQRGDQ
jgi:hypothetical protein